MEDTTTTAPPDPAAEERQRRNEIRMICRGAGLSNQLADELIDDGATLDQAKARAFDEVQSRSRSRPIIRSTQPANDDPQVIVRRQTDALVTRMTGAEPPEDARQYVDHSLKDMARSSLERAGISTRGMSANEIWTRSTAMHTTSDFPRTVANVANRVALDAYKAAESPMKMLARRKLVADFKPATAVRHGALGRLEPLAEGGEIRHVTRAEHGEEMRVSTYAGAINVSRELLVNDDLGLMGDLSASFGEAAAETERDLLVQLLTSNPALSDGVAVFHSSRGNVAGTGTALGDAGGLAALEAARLAMRGYRGIDQQTLVNVVPRYLLTGPASESEAEKIVADIQAATIADVNPFASKLQLLVEPRLEGDDWFVFADPARFAGLVYAYLSSAVGPQIQRAEMWDQLGLKFRCWLDFGCAWTDWRAAYMNPGSV